MSDKKKRSAQDMMDRLQSANKAEEKEEAKKLNIKSILIGLLIAILIGSAGFLVISRLPQNQSVENQVKIEDTSKEPALEAYSVVDLPSWAKKPYDMLTAEEMKQMVADQENNFIGWIANSLPSEKDGFTSDKSKEYDEDGLPNEYFTNKTKEKFTKDVSVAIYRVINPIFGNWVDFQGPTATPDSEIITRIYKNLGSADYVESLINEKADSVILYDKNKDLYGGNFKEASKGKPNQFVGIIKDGDVSFNADNSVKVDLEVDYYSSANTIYKTKKITFTLQDRGDGNYEIVGGTINDK